MFLAAFRTFYIFIAVEHATQHFELAFALFTLVLIDRHNILRTSSFVLLLSPLKDRLSRNRRTLYTKKGPASAVRKEFPVSAVSFHMPSPPDIYRPHNLRVCTYYN
jgi:hypothetical protein